MSFEPEYLTTETQVDLGIRKEQVTVSARSDVPSESVERIISVTADPFACADGKGGAGFAGKVNFSVCYRDKEGALKKYECGKEFAGDFSDADGVILKKICAKTEKCEADISGINLSVSAIVSVSATATGKKEVSCLSGGEGLIVNRAEKEVVKRYKAVTGAYPVIEEFELDYPVKEVLAHRATVIKASAQCGVGTVIIDGEAVITSIVLPNSEKGGIIKETKTIPLRLEVEYDDAMPTCDAEADIFLKSFKSEITVDETNGKSSVEASLSVGYEVSATVNETILIADDAFSTTEIIKCETGKFGFLRGGVTRVEKQKVFLRATVPALSSGETVIATYNDAALPVSVKKEGKGVTVSGAYSAEVFSTGENGIKAVKIETPFSVGVPEFEYNGNVSVAVFPTLTTTREITAEEIEIAVELALVFTCEETVEIKYIANVESDGEKKGETSGISVYIAREGEDLWSLSKRLNVCPDDLSESNKDLRFPLTGDERIAVFRRKQ